MFILSHSCKNAAKLQNFARMGDFFCIFMEWVDSVDSMGRFMSQMRLRLGKKSCLGDWNHNFSAQHILDPIFTIISQSCIVSLNLPVQIFLLVEVSVS